MKNNQNNSPRASALQIMFPVTFILLSAALLTLTAAPATKESEQKTAGAEMAFQTAHCRVVVSPLSPASKQPDAQKSAHMDDPAQGTWRNTGVMSTARASHTATLLRNGKVLVAGGQNVAGLLSSAELYDPAARAWTATGSLATRREFHTATLLPSGKVLVAGGDNGTILLSTAELYDPATGSWAATGSLATGRDLHTATLLPSGKVLVAGGLGFGIPDPTILSSAELYDPATGSWTATGSLAITRDYHTATLLPSGEVLVAGGFQGTSYPTSTELYDPSAGTWTPTGSLNSPRYEHTATLLRSGKVLVAGGYNDNSYFLTSTELYNQGLGVDSNWQPLFARSRPQCCKMVAR
jgi:Galactose oxidase, central domain/Kelch motif